MEVYGKYGGLTAVEAAKASLLDIEKDIPDGDLAIISSPSFLNSLENYNLYRLKMTIEGLQMVVWLNDGYDPTTKLPSLFDQKKYRGRHEKKLVGKK